MAQLNKFGMDRKQLGLLLIFPENHLLAVLSDNYPLRLKLLILIRFVRNIRFLDRHSGVSFNGWVKPFTNFRVSAGILISYKFPKWLLQAVTQWPVTVLLAGHIFFLAASSVGSAESAEPGPTGNLQLSETNKETEEVLSKHMQRAWLASVQCEKSWEAQSFTSSTWKRISQLFIGWKTENHGALKSQQGMIMKGKRT